MKTYHMPKLRSMPPSLFGHDVFQSQWAYTRYMPLVSIDHCVVVWEQHQCHMKDSSADTLVAAEGSYSASTLGSVNSFLIAQKASSCGWTHHQSRLLLSNSVIGQMMWAQFGRNLATWLTIPMNWHICDVLDGGGMSRIDFCRISSHTIFVDYVSKYVISAGLWKTHIFLG